MKGDRGLLVAVIALGVLAVVAFGLVSLGRTSNEVLPSSLLSDPGGSLALFELLQESGVPVERAYTPLRGKKRDDVGIVIVFDDWGLFDMSSLWASSDGGGGDLSSIPIRIHAPVSTTLPRLRDVETVPVKSDFAVFGSVRELVVPGTASRVEHGIQLLTSDLGYPMVYAELKGKGVDVYLSNGFVFLNRFIGHGDNAQLAVTLVRSLLPKGKKVLFPEYRYGIRSPENLFTRLGPSFSSVLIQLLFVFALLVYTLGKRFGYPDEDVPSKPGARDFVRAMAEVFRRGRCTDIVLETELKRVIREVSRKMGFPADMPEEERLRRIPAPLGATMREIYLKKGSKVKPAESADLVARLNRQLSEFQGRQP